VEAKPGATTERTCEERTRRRREMMKVTRMGGATRKTMKTGGGTRNKNM
jgi:hypothetical protein